jgi:hypothetical protein
MHPRMLLLTLVPFLFSVLIWTIFLWLGLPVLTHWIHGFVTAQPDMPFVTSTITSLLIWLGIGTIQAVLIPLLSMWIILPLMIFTALLFVGVQAMPIVINHVASRRYPTLERRMGGSLWGTLGISLSSFVMFAVVWIVTLPLLFIPPLALLMHPLLWGWLTYRVMAYDALAAHADRHECRFLMREHRWPLLAIGLVVSLFGAAPTVLWLGGVLTVIFFPIIAGVAIWLYVLVFIFSGLWFAHYCLAALAQLRASDIPMHINQHDLNLHT